MSTAEKLALMTAHGVSIGHIPGGAPYLTAEDVAGALGMAHLKRGPYLLMLAKYCGDDTVLYELYNYAWFQAVDVANAKGWKPVKGKEYIRRMSVLAVDQVLKSQRCKSCKGVRWVGNTSCRRCDGSGMEAAMGGVKMSKELDMPVSTWYATWAPRYATIANEIMFWEVDALNRIQSRLRDRKDS